MVLIVVGGTLIIFGFAFAIVHKGDESAGLQVFKINVSGASWLILVVLGVMCIGGWWWFDNEHVNESMKDPASETPVSTMSEAAFEESFADEPYAFGDDGDLDQLWLSCESGAMQACDDLYQQSPVGSEYETFGATCGEIFEMENAPEFCVDAPIEDTSADVSTGDFEIESSDADLLTTGG